MKASSASIPARGPCSRIRSIDAHNASDSSSPGKSSPTQVNGSSNTGADTIRSITGIRAKSGSSATAARSGSVKAHASPSDVSSRPSQAP